MERVLPRNAQIEARGDVPLPLILVVLLAAEGVIAWIVNHFVVSQDLVIAASGGQLDPAQAERMLQLSERYRWLGYATIVPSLLVRLALVALVLQLAMLYFESASLTFGVVFRAAAFAHLARAGESLVAAVWWMGADATERTARFLAGNPLSLSVMVDRDGPLGMFKPVIDQLSLGSAAWILIAASLLASHARLERRSVLVSVLLASLAMVAARFAFSEALTAFAS